MERRILFKCIDSLKVLSSHSDPGVMTGFGTCTIDHCRDLLTSSFFFCIANSMHPLLLDNHLMWGSRNNP